MERWQRIPGFEKYAVSDLGQVCNLRRDSLVAPSINRQGIAKVTLFDSDGQATSRSLAPLVAEAFLAPVGPLFDTPIQLDGNRRNCRADNLMWRPRWFAVKYHRQFYVERFRFGHRTFMEVESREIFEDYVKPCTTYGLLHTSIILSYLNRGEERVFPTHQRFRLVEPSI